MVSVEVNMLFTVDFLFSFENTTIKGRGSEIKSMANCTRETRQTFMDFSFAFFGTFGNDVRSLLISLKNNVLGSQ